MTYNLGIRVADFSALPFVHKEIIEDHILHKLQIAQITFSQLP